MLSMGNFLRGAGRLAVLKSKALVDMNLCKLSSETVLIERLRNASINLGERAQQYLLLLSK